MARDLKSELNRLTRVAKAYGLGDQLEAIIGELDDVRAKYTTLLADVTAMRTSFNTAMTKLNADAGVTDTNYAAAAALNASALAVTKASQKPSEVVATS